MRWITVAVLGGLAVVPCPAPACSLCGGLNQLTLRQEIAQAKVVLYGTLSNARLGGDPSRPGAGTTELNILKVVKEDSSLAGRKVVQLQRYLPILDPRDPPKVLVFCERINGQLDPYRGRAVRSAAVLEYLAGARAVDPKGRARALQYYFRYLDHPDEAIASDAFLEFARSTDQEVGEAGRLVEPAQLRRLIQDPKTPASRLGLFAFMLGACGDGSDAELLRSMIERPPARAAGALDGLVSGYVSLKPADGWELVARILADRRRPFNERFAVSRTLRFYHSWKPAESRPQVLRCLAVMVEDGELADLAVEDLRQWKMWELTDKVLAQYGRSSHAAPIIKRSIGRYALACPERQARQFIEQLRQREPALVQDLEELLSFEQQR